LRCCLSAFVPDLFDLVVVLHHLMVERRTSFALVQMRFDLSPAIFYLIRFENEQFKRMFIYMSHGSLLVPLPRIIYLHIVLCADYSLMLRTDSSSHGCMKPLQGLRTLVCFIPEGVALGCSICPLQGQSFAQVDAESVGYYRLGQRPNQRTSQRQETLKG
jgi:hypothetical protein